MLNDIWYNTNSIITELKGVYYEGREIMYSVKLESIRGLLVHVASIYSYMNPYHKVLYLTLDIWRP